MADILKSSSDPNRLRIMLLLRNDELSVNEIVEIMEMNQSAVSNQLSSLKKAGILKNRKEGKRIYYSLNDGISRGASSSLFEEIFLRGEQEAFYHMDRKALSFVLNKRREESLNRFSQRKKKSGPCPGESWEAFARGFISLVRGKRIADLGCGSGRLAAMLADGGNRVTGYDNDKEQLEEAWNKADSFNGRLDFKFWDIETDIPEAENGHFDLAVLSQTLHHLANPAKSLKIVKKMLRPQGQLIIFDLAHHNEEVFKDLYGDYWLGFESDRLIRWLREAGFDNISIQKVPSGENEVESLIVLAYGA